MIGGMETTETPPLVFKKYRRTTPGERVQRVRRYLSSGLTHREFSRRHGVSTTALSEWVRNVRQQQDQARQLAQAKVVTTPDAKPMLKEVSLGAVMGGPRWVGELNFPSGTVLRLTSDMPAELLKELIQGVIC